ncbi:major facilitator superfamily domain-containing protein [Aspergillus californicus]
MDSDKAYTETYEDVPAVESHASPNARWRKAIIAVLAVNALAYGQMVALVGSGLLATQTTTLLDDSSKSSWLSTVITILIIALNPMLSQMADYWGRKWITVITSLGGVAGPILISRAQNINSLIAGFCLLGIAFGSQSSFYTVVSEVLPRQYRSIAQAGLSITMSIAAISAILIGGALLRNDNYENYRIFWYIVTGIYVLSLAGLLLGYNPPPRELETSLTSRQKLASLDWTGVLLLTTSMVTFCIALQWSGNPYSWANAHVNAPFAVGMVLAIAFVVYEWQGRKDGLVHHDLFGHRNFSIALASIFIEGLSFLTCNSYFTFQVQVITQTNLFFSVGFYTVWTKQLRVPLLFGFVCFTVFNALMASVKASTLPGVLWGYPVLGGIGIGCLLTNLTVIVQMSTPTQMISVATGLLFTVRGLGGCVGLAINNAIFSQGLSKLDSKIAAAVLPLQFPAAKLGYLIQGLVSGDTLLLMQDPDVTPAVLAAGGAALADTYAIAFRGVWICAAAFSGTGLILACFLQDVKSEFTQHVDAPILECKQVSQGGDRKL